MYAVSGGHKEVVGVLIKEFHFNVNSRGYNGRTLLHEACLQGHTDLVRELVNEFGADLYAVDADGDNALMCAVIGNQSDVVQLLIEEFGFDVNPRNFDGLTPLIKAFQYDHVDLAEELICRFKADTFVRDRYGHNCVMHSAETGSLTVASFLVSEYNFDANTHSYLGETPLLVACYYGHVDFVTYLIGECGEAVDLEVEDMNGNNAVMYAAYGSQEAMVRFLVKDLGYDVNSSNHDLQTPAFLASLEGNVSLLKVLVTELGASLLVEDKNGETPFSIAVSEGQQDIVEFLVSEFPNDVERCIDYLLTKFLNKVEVIRGSVEQSESEVLADVEMSYIELVEQMKIFAQKESKYSNEKIEELKEVMLELEVMLWTRLEERKETLEKEINTTNSIDKELQSKLKAVQTSIIRTNQKIEGLMERIPLQNDLQHYKGSLLDPVEMEITLRAGEAQSFQCPRYGFKLHVPKQALPDKLSDCNILIRVNPSCQYKFPENTDLVSAIYQISCSVELTKPVILEIQHCAIIERPGQSSFLTFVRAEDSHQIQFQPIGGGEFSSFSSYAKISLKKFSILAVILYYVTLGYYQIDYYTKVYVTPSPIPTQRKFEVFCVVLRNLSAVLTEAQRHCVNRTVYEEFNIRFESDEITFEIDEKNLSDWKIIRTHIPSTVLKAHVDSYDGSVCPPHCTFRVTWMGGDREPDVIPLQLVGTKRPHCCNIELPDIVNTSTTVTTQESTQAAFLAEEYNVTDQKLDTMITDEHINDVSLFLPKWEQVANQLGVDPLQINDIKQEPGIARNHGVLTAWKNAKYEMATYRRLVEVLDKLKEVKRAHKVCELIR